VLTWLRAALQKRDLNVAAFAEKVGEKRSVVRKVLSGKEPLTVDQLMSWTQVLEIALEDLVQVPEGVPTVEGLEVAPVDDSVAISPYGLHAEQSIRMAFAMGVDFAFVADTSQLDNSGVPQTVLARFPERILIKLDAAYHKYNSPIYDDYGITVTLSFDSIYTCSFPWSSVVQVTVYCEPPDPTDPPGDEPEPEAETSRPTLRLVK
jgi:transcriptional regulator with XRE-family HTH domain